METSRYSQQWADELASDNGYKKRYLNSGVFVAKTTFLKELLPEALEYVTDHDLSIVDRKNSTAGGLFPSAYPCFRKEAAVIR